MPDEKTQNAVAPTPVPLIPREVLFGNPEKAAPEISPDGRRLAYLAPDEGVLNVWVRTVGSQDDRAVTRDRKRGIMRYLWPFDNRHLLYLQDRDGDENWHIWSVDLESSPSDIQDVTPFENVQAQLIDVDPRFPNEILVGLNQRDPTVHDVYRLYLDTGRVEMEVENPGNVVGWIADSEFRVRARQVALPDGGFQLQVRETVDSAWKPLVTWGPDEEGTPYGFAPGDQSLYVGSSLGSDTIELRQIDAATGEERTIASNPRVDLGEALIHPTERRVQAVGFNEDRLEWMVLDESIAPDLAFLMGERDAEVHVASRSLDDRTWVVLYTFDNAPAACYLYDRPSQKLEFLFTTRAALEKYTLARMHPIHITARDGLTLHCYLTLPPEHEHTFDPDTAASGGGPPKLNLPLVLNVHGGPWARDVWRYHPEAQWLANRGYACLQVNYRGSTGFGKRFLHAGDREWAGKMHDDLLDAVDWAVQAGIADPRRVGIYGGSYGGYAALVGATFTPEVFACSVDVVGPSSIRTLINSIPPYWEPLRRVFTVRVGDPETEPEFLDSLSPLFKVDQIRCPLLIAQGANDPRVKQAESEQIVEAMRAAGKPVEYMLFEDEGHGFARPENRLKFYAAMEAFIARYLGGRTGP